MTKELSLGVWTSLFDTPCIVDTNSQINIIGTIEQTLTALNVKLLYK